MCGIFGIINFSTLQKPQFKKSIELLKHRGPNSLNEKIFSNVALGFTRLAIQDLSIAGNQPMTHSKSLTHIVFNGEIYNYLILRDELKNEGASFNTRTDTEVILNAYFIWGWEKTLEKLEGMFSIGLFDEKENLFYLARDRFGMKPLFYTEFKNSLIFSSEIKSILNYTQNRKLNLLNSLNPIFTTGLSPRGTSMFDSVEQLEPGHYLRYDLVEKKFRVVEYFHLSNWVSSDKYNFIASANKNNVLQLYEEALNDSVKLHLISDAPLGIMFSAGLDSSLISAVASNFIKKKISLLYFESDKQDDAHFANEFTKKFNAELISTKGGDKEYIFDLPKMIYHFETINKADSLVLGNLCKLAQKKGFKSLLSGDSSDEIFGGQEFHTSFLKQSKYHHNKFYNKLYRVINRLLPNSFLSYSGIDPVSSHYFNFPTGINFFEVPSNCLFHGGHRLKDWQRCLGAYDFIKNNAIRNTLGYILDEISYRLQRYMIRSDRYGMMESIEIRTPFLHPSVIKLAVNTPPDWFIKQKWMGLKLEKKHIIRKLAKKAGVPIKIINRKKIGTPFDTTPIIKILQNWKLEYLSDFLKLDTQTLQDIIFNSYDPFIERIQFGFISTEILAKIFIDGQSHENIAEEFRSILHK